MHLQENALCDLDLWVKVTQNVTQYSACTTFLKQEVMTSTLRDLEVTGQNCGSQDFARAAKNVNL